jgi:hypothetical protein
MKNNLICIASIIVIATFSSCAKEKDFTCECTYVPSALHYPAGTPNKVETNIVKGFTAQDADVNCSFRGKYMTQFYTGTCLIK